MADGANSLQVFVPAHSPVFSTFVARVDGNAEDRLAMVRDAIHPVDTQVSLFDVKTMERRELSVAGCPAYRTLQRRVCRALDICRSAEALPRLSETAGQPGALGRAVANSS